MGRKLVRGQKQEANHATWCKVVCKVVDVAGQFIEDLLHFLWNKQHTTI